jgi:hypothetical protein
MLPFDGSAADRGTARFNGGITVVTHLYRQADLSGVIPGRLSANPRHGDFSLMWIASGFLRSGHPFSDGRVRRLVGADGWSGRAARLR